MESMPLKAELYYSNIYRSFVEIFSDDTQLARPTWQNYAGQKALSVQIAKQMRPLGRARRGRLACASFAATGSHASEVLSGGVHF